MKIGIITAHWPRNYGAVLQAHALTKTLNLLGYNSEIINFMTDFQEKHLGLCPPFTLKKPKTIAVSVIRASNNLLHYKSWKRRKNNFEDFAGDYLPIAKKRYRSYAELVADPPQYDAYICGSDQIWRSIEGSTTRFDPTYYLSFVKDCSKRIAYAPSFGADYIPAELRDEYKKRLLNIPHLSIREISGQAIIKQLTGIEVPVVLDPTLLLTSDYWKSILREPKLQSPYILVYVVAGDRKKMGDLVGRVKQKFAWNIKDVKVVAITDIATKIANVDIVVPSAHPLEYLGWFSKASFVCTTSFHGMVFSFIFNKPFYALMPHRISTRLKSLGDILGLSPRFVGEDMFDIPDDFMHFDYNQADQKWNEAKEFSIRFLKDVLKVVC